MGGGSRQYISPPHKHRCIRSSIKIVKYIAPEMWMNPANLFLFQLLSYRASAKFNVERKRKFIANGVGVGQKLLPIGW